MYKLIATTFLMVAVVCVALAPQVDSANTDAASIGDRTFSSLEDALSSSVAGDTVFLLRDYTLTADVTVPEGVTLVIPYSEELYGDGTMDGPDMESTSRKIHHNDKVHITLTIPSGATLKVDGEFIIGGILSRPFTFDYQGHTSADHSVVRNNGSITVDNGGVLKCYGYIKGNGTVLGESGSTIYEPFVVTEYVGGDCVYVQYDNHQSPFDRYATVNIQSELRLEYGSILKGMMNLYANNSYNKAEVVLVGTTEGFIRLSPDATYTSVYHPEMSIEEDWESNIYRDIGKRLITISGGATTGSVKISYQGYTADTGDTVFSIPYNYSYVLKDGEYVIANPYRLLPGATMTVASDATLVVKDELLVFPGLYSTEFKDKHYPRPETLSASPHYTDSAVLTVEGTMIIEGTFRGTVSGAMGALIHVHEGADVSENVVKHGAIGNFQGSSIRNLSEFTLSGHLFASDGTVFRMVPGESCQIVDMNTHPMGSLRYRDVVNSTDGIMELTSTVTGSWVSSAFTVTYDVNGGHGDTPVDDTPYAHDGDAVISDASGIYNVRHVFREWNTSPDGTGASYKGGDTIRMTDDLTLYAIWTHVGGEGFYVIYEGNSDYDGPVPKDLDPHTDAATIMGPVDMTLTGHEFRGWNTSPDGTGTGYREGDTIHSTTDVILYGIWELGTYDISLDSNGGSDVEAITALYGTGITAPENPVREGYTFIGWSPELPRTMPWKGMTVTAQWKINEYLVTFDSNGGSDVRSILVEYDSPIPMPREPTWYGYLFLGWSPEIPETMPARSITLTAQWEALPFFDLVVETNGHGTTSITTGNYPLYHTVQVNLVPDNGYRVGSVRLDGVETSTSAVQAVTIASDHILTVEFVPAPGTTTIDNGDGTVSTRMESDIEGYKAMFTITESSSGVVSLESVVSHGNLKAVSLYGNGKSTTTATVELMEGQGSLDASTFETLIWMASTAESQTGKDAPIDLVVSSKHSDAITIPRVDVNSLNVVCRNVGILIPNECFDRVFIDGSATFEMGVAMKNDLNQAQKDAAGPMTIVRLSINGGTVSELGTAVKVTVDYIAKGRVTAVEHLAEDGTTETKVFKTMDGTVVFETDQLSLYRIVDDGVREPAWSLWISIAGLLIILAVVGVVAYMRMRG